MAIDRCRSGPGWCSSLCVLIWFPLMAVLRLVTAPFDRGRYPVGYLFRQIPVVMATLNPLWRFRCAGTMPRRSPPAVRRGVQPRVVRRHPAHQPPALGDEVAVQGRAVPDSGAGLDDAAGGRHPGPARLRPERRRGHRPVPRGAGEPGVGDDLPRGHPVHDRRPAAVQGRRVPPGHRRRRADPAARRARHRAPRSPSTTGGSAARPPSSGCSSRSRPRASRRPTCPALKERVRAA